MIRLGFHIPIVGGWKQTLGAAVRRRCTTCQVFTSAPVQWRRRTLDPDAAAWFAAELQSRDIWPLFVHAPYLLNIASPNRSLLSKSLRCLADELERAALLQAVGVVLHLGSIGDRGRLAAGLRRVARTLDRALEATDLQMPLVLENCAGHISHSRYPQRLQVCLDTAHAFAAGYPLHTQQGLDELLASLDEQLGSERLVLIHANDTTSILGSRVDRHWHIGKGNIGTTGFRRLLNHPRLADKPFIMETPGTEDDDHRNMRAIRRLIDADRRPPLPPL